MRGLLLPVIVLLGACGGTSSEPGEGSYSMVELNDSPLPYDDDPGCCVYLGGSLELDGSRYGIGIHFRNKINLIDTTFVERGRYDVTGEEIRFFMTEADFPLGLSHGVLVGDTVRVRFGGEGPGSDEQFRAVFQKNP